MTKLSGGSDPIQRFLQKLAVSTHATVMVISGCMIYFLTAYIIFFTRYYLAGLAYVCYILIDESTTFPGSRASDWVRRWSWWVYYKDYFPMRLIKTAELDPSKNYLLCAFPHGVLSSGSSGNFATEANNVSEMFPGITHNVTTLNYNVYTPIVREMLVRMGICSCSKKNVALLLDKSNGTGRSVVLIVGGAAEARITQPGANRVFLKNRKGFVKMALKYGAPLVPMYTFGENDLFDYVFVAKGGWLMFVDKVFRKVLGIAPLLPHGRGLFQDYYGIVPLRRPITTVVGKPIAAEHIPDPNQEQIDDLHSRFQEQLVALFEEHKHKYLKNPEGAQLIIL